MLQTINQLSDGVTATNSTANVETTVWDIKLPETVMRLVQGNHKLRLFLYDGSMTPVRIASGQVILAVTDPQQNHKKVIYRGDLSLFTGSQINELETQRVGNTWGAFPFYHILINVKSATAVTAANSTFGLECEQVDNISFEESKQSFPEYLLG
jgi:hypothetical protein